MRLNVGSSAPDFTLSTLDGTSLSLSDLRGQRVWLAIFRFTACPFCLRRVHQLSLEADRIRALPLRRLAIFPSRPELLKKYLVKFPLPFEILADLDESVAERYGAETSVLGTLKSLRRPSRIIEGIEVADGWSPFDGGGSKTRMPADFLLDEDHNIRVAFYGSEADDGVPIDEVEKFMQEGLERSSIGG